MTEALRNKRRNQSQSYAIIHNHTQSVAISRNQASMPAAHSNWASRREIVARRRSRVRGPLPLRAARRTARRGFRSRSEAIRGHHRQSEVIRGHQRPSEALTCETMISNRLPTR